MSADSFKDSGNKAQQAGDYDLAIEMYTKAIEIDGQNHVYFSNRSASYLSKGGDPNGRKALQDADRCIELNPQWPKGYSRKGAALHRLQRYDEAMDAYNLGLAISPSDAGLSSGLEEVRKARSSQRSSGLNNLLPMMINKLATSPKYAPKLADPVFMSKLRMLSNPDTMASVASDPEMMDALGLVFGMAAGDNTNATSTDAHDDDDDYAHSHVQPPQQPRQVEVEEEEVSEAIRLKNLGNSEYKNKNFESAISHYTSSSSSPSATVEVIVTCKYNIAACQLALKAFDDGLTVIQEAIDYGRANRAPFALLGKCYARQAKLHVAAGATEPAIESLKKALLEDYDKDYDRQLKCLELDLRQQQARAYEDVGKSEEAKERGNESFRSSDYDGAIGHYEEAIKRNPKNPSLFNNLAAVHLKRLDLNAGLSAVTRALELDESYVKAWAKKGEIEFLMKEYHKSLASYQRGLDLDSGNEACRSGLMKTRRSLSSGEYDEERAQHAMADPEIQDILHDPIIQQVLREMQNNPMEAQRAMNKDADVARKMEKLITSGAIQFNKK